MSTRGAWGFRKDNVDKITYNHCDSYPSGLGETIKSFIHNHTITRLKKISDKIILVDSKSIPTREQINECRAFADVSVSMGNLSEWYVLLRNAQGDPEAYAGNLKYMIDGCDFIKDSLFCEYAYVINLDTEKLEIYEGFQKRPQKNRYMTVPKSKNDYANCKLIIEVDLDKVKDFDMEKVE